MSWRPTRTAGSDARYWPDKIRTIYISTVILPAMKHVTQAFSSEKSVSTYKPARCWHAEGCYVIVTRRVGLACEAARLGTAGFCDSSNTVLAGRLTASQYGMYKGPSLATTDTHTLTRLTHDATHKTSPYSLYSVTQCTNFTTAFCAFKTSHGFTV